MRDRREPNLNMRTGTKLPCKRRVPSVVLKVNQEELQKWIGLIQNRADRFLDIFNRSAHDQKHRNGSVCPGRAPRRESISGRTGEPGFQKDEQRGQCAYPGKEEEDGGKPVCAHTYFLKSHTQNCKLEILDNFLASGPPI